MAEAATIAEAATMAEVVTIAETDIGTEVTEVTIIIVPVTVTITVHGFRWPLSAQAL